MGKLSTYLRGRLDAMKRKAASYDQAESPGEHLPNATTRAAICELDSGGGTHHESIEDLMRDLES